MPKNWKRRLLTIVLTGACAVGVALTVSPPLRSHFGSVDAAASRGGSLDFALPAVGGGTWRLADYRGKVVLVNFWATWCPPCRMETPGLVQVYKEYSPRGFTMVGISLDEEPDKAVPGFAARYGMTYPVLVPSAGMPLADRVQAVPTSFLLDSEGRIAREYDGMISESVLKSDVDRLLAEKGQAGDGH